MRLLPLGLSLLVAACAFGTRYAADDAASRWERLAPCSGTGSMYAGKPLVEWAWTYHSRANEVIEANLRELGGEQCILNTDTDYELPPTPELIGLAASLPPWQNPQALVNLSESDIGAVLLEHLRVYECALLEYRDFYLPYSASGSTVEQGLRAEQNTETERFINDELDTARPALDTVLLVLGQINRMQPFTQMTECLAQVSAELNNEMGLIAEVSSCLAKTHDARGSLREIPPDRL